MKKVKQLAALGLSVAMIAGLCACGDNGGQEGSSTPDSGVQDSSAQESSSQDSSQEPSSQEAASNETQESGKPVTLEWWYRGNGVQKDTEMVEDAFNELLQTYPGMENVTVHFNCYTGGEYKNSVILAQSEIGRAHV